MGIFRTEMQFWPKILVAESTQVCYTLLACGVSSRNRLLCALDGATEVGCAEVQETIITNTASQLCFALKQSALQNLEHDIDNMSCVGTG